MGSTVEKAGEGSTEGVGRMHSRGIISGEVTFELEHEEELDGRAGAGQWHRAWCVLGPSVSRTQPVGQAEKEPTGWEHGDVREFYQMKVRSEVRTTLRSLGSM